MSETKKQQMLKKLEDLKSIVDMPNLFLANYFQELRNNVDKEMFSKQILHKNDIEKKNELNQIWIELISKIDSFEKECKNKDELQSNSNRIDEIKIILDNKNELTNLEIIEDKILEEEFNLLKKLFQNKTIIYEFFEKQQQQDEEEEDDIEEEEEQKQDTQKRLLIIDDEYVNWISLEKM